MALMPFSIGAASYVEMKIESLANLIPVANTEISTSSFICTFAYESVSSEGVNSMKCTVSTLFNSSARVTIKES